MREAFTILSARSFVRVAQMVAFVVLARALQLREVTAVLGTVTRRLARTREA